MDGLSPEQADFFNRATRVYGHGHLSSTIKDAKSDLIKRNESGTIVRSGRRVIGFTPEKRDETKK